MKSEANVAASCKKRCGRLQASSTLKKLNEPLLLDRCEPALRSSLERQSKANGTSSTAVSRVGDAMLAAGALPSTVRPTTAK